MADAKVAPAEKSRNVFGGEKLKPKEKAALVNIDAARVRAFMEAIRYLAPVRSIGGVEVEIEGLDDRFEIPKSTRGQSKVQEHFEKRAATELLWGGVTADGIGVAYIGAGETQGGVGITDRRKVPEIGIIADPEREKILILPAKLWEGNAEDGWDSGWSQYSYLAADFEQGLSAFKPVDEWGISERRGVYGVSLIQDPHFLYNDELQTAEILLRRNHGDIQATLGHRVVCLAGEKRGFPAYNFERQITSRDDVFTMPHIVLTSYSSPCS